MPWTYTLENETVRVAVLRASGMASRDEWLTALRALAEDARLQVETPVLIDTRGMTNLPEPGRTPAILADLAQWLQPQRIAWVAASDALFGIGRQLELMSDGRILAFKDEAEARSWLGIEPADTAPAG
jgi:hypothetical protein